MKKQALLITVFLGSLTLATAAQAQPRALDQLYPGYSATILSSPEAVEHLMSEMPMPFKVEGMFRNGSQCFHRAEIWSYDMYRNKHVNAMKTFVFYTFAYKQAYQAMTGRKFIWWFHVAPYVLNKGANGELQESVLDPTFADKPLNVADWSMLFVDTHKACKEWVRYEDFKSEVVEGPGAHVGKEHCYLVRVPATDFDPTSVEARDLGQVTNYQWDLGNVSIAIQQGVYGSARNDMRARLGL